MRVIVALAFAISVAGCASTSVIPMTRDTFEITSSAAPVCGTTGAQKVAVQQAAVEAIRRGYDRFMIVGGQGGQSYVGSTPVVVQGLGNGAIAYGGAPLVSHSQGLMVKMFRDGDPAGANALSARETLGPQWEEIVAKKTMTCLG